MSQNDREIEIMKRYHQSLLEIQATRLQFEIDLQKDNITLADQLKYKKMAATIVLSFKKDMKQL